MSFLAAYGHFPDLIERPSLNPRSHSSRACKNLGAKGTAISSNLVSLWSTFMVQLLSSTHRE
jgi:hypothetical protein